MKVRQVKKSVSLLPEERADLEALIAKGVDVTAQMVPDDAEVEMSKFLK